MWVKNPHLDPHLENITKSNKNNLENNVVTLRYFLANFLRFLQSHTYVSHVCVYVLYIYFIYTRKSRNKQLD